MCVDVELDVKYLRHRRHFCLFLTHLSRSCPHSHTHSLRIAACVSEVFFIFLLCVAAASDCVLLLFVAPERARYTARRSQLQLSIRARMHACVFVRNICAWAEDMIVISMLLSILYQHPNTIITTTAFLFTHTPLYLTFNL